MLLHPCSQRDEKLENLLKNCIKNRVFSGCSVGYFQCIKNSMFEDTQNYGYTNTDNQYPVTENSFFDLASLTKPLVTALSVFELVKLNKICLGDSLDKYFPNIAKDVGKITIYQLLNHSSGFAAHKDFAKKLLYHPIEVRKDKVTEWILGEDLTYLPGEKIIYSDLGYIILGRIIEQITDKSLDTFWNESISTPKKLDNSLFFMPKEKLDKRVCVQTGSCSWSQIQLCGKVHDDNCRALGGVAGHAGLFGSLKGVMRICESLIQQHRDNTFPLTTENKKCEKIIPGSWFYGFDTPTPGVSSSGRYFSEQSVGHLGFTGTSFWIDFKESIGVVFLTNRVVYGDNPEVIRKLRPQIHDIIMRETD